MAWIGPEQQVCHTAFKIATHFRRNATHFSGFCHTLPLLQIDMLWNLGVRSQFISVCMWCNNSTHWYIYILSWLSVQPGGQGGWLGVDVHTNPPLWWWVGLRVSLGLVLVLGMVNHYYIGLPQVTGFLYWGSGVRIDVQCWQFTAVYLSCGLQ